MGGQFAVKKGKEPSHFDDSHGFLLFPLDCGYDIKHKDFIY